MLRGLAVAIALVWAGGVSAQPVSGLYVGAGLGLNQQEVARSNDFPNGLDSRLGGAGVVSVGWGFWRGVRVEIEASFRGDPVAASPYRGVARTGWVGTSAGMANLLYEFDLRGWGIPVQPYVGVGVGYAGRHSRFQESFSYPTLAFVNGNLVSATATNASRANGTGGSLAYQAIGGMAWPVAAVPGLAVTAEYRYLRTEEAPISSSYRYTSPSYQFAGRFTQDFGSAHHSALIGLRYNFGVVRPAVVATVPAQIPHIVDRLFLIFFDWNSTTLTDRARQIIGEAASPGMMRGITRLDVSGHADRSGTPEFNQRLSQRRAEAVGAALMSQGVARETIIIRGFGESRPLVPTADGAREPQNRRVEIVHR